MKKIAIDVLTPDKEVLKTFHYLSTDEREAREYFVNDNFTYLAYLPYGCFCQVRDLGYYN